MTGMTAKGFGLGSAEKLRAERYAGALAAESPCSSGKKASFHGGLETVAEKGCSVPR